ncbi:MAG TPA: ArsR family transcriptional regulator [Geobacter sp.]|nr:ArsR family transcriptional regulator [Geobacter sp.]
MNEPAQIFRALADETRLRILALLLSQGELCVCDIIAALKLPQSTVSRHLAYLRKSGLVSDRRCGLWMYYSLAPEQKGFRGVLIQFLRQNLADFPTTKADSTSLAVCADGRCCD